MFKKSIIKFLYYMISLLRYSAVVFFIYTITFSLPSNLSAQNIVDNVSFENYDSLPSLTNPGLISYQYWFDCNYNLPLNLFAGWCMWYFHPNSSHPYHIVPNNGFGYPLAYDGIAYTGFELNKGANCCHPEAKFLEPMVAGEKYCIKFYYSVADYCPPPWPNSINLEVLITDYPIGRSSAGGYWWPIVVNGTPQFSKPVIFDTTNWISYSVEYIAKGGEEYITIGNFTDDINLTNQRIWLYLDMFEVGFCKNTDTIINVDTLVDSLIIPNVFTPNGDGFNDKFVYKNQEDWEYETQIYNRWGNKIFDNTTSENWDGYYKGNKVSCGVYFFLIKATAIKTGEIKIHTGSITVLY